MAKKKELAGVRIDDCSLEEAIYNIEEYLSNNCINIVEAINMKTIVAAGEDEDVRSCLEEMDMVVPADKEILHEMGITSEERLQEIQENQLFYETLERICQGNYNLYLLTETQEQKGRLADYLSGTYDGKLIISGSYALEDGKGDLEDVVNEVNAVAPHVILATLSTPLQERFVYEHRQMLNAKLWFGIGTESSIMAANSLGRLYKKFLVKQKMKRQIQSYEMSDKEETSE